MQSSTEIESILARLESLEVNRDLLAGRIRFLEKLIDTRATPLWRRLLFRIDGWPAWCYLAVRPTWRPWRRWWTS